MTLPNPRGFVRATIASLAPLVVSLLAAVPADAQDCWLPDVFEPNDAVPTTVGVGIYTGLRISGADPYRGPDVDRFRVHVPPLQRLALDFDVPPLPAGTAVNNNRLFGTIEPEDGSEPARVYDTAPSGIARPAVYDNATNQTVAVLFTVERDSHQPVGCTEYAMQVSITPRPCDVLSDDALEGPDTCANAAVLPVGVHSGLVVFNDRRTAGRDADVYRIPNVAPGDWFEVEISGEANDGSTPKLEVFSGSDCNGLLVQEYRRVYVTNTTSSPSDYTVRVSTDHIAGFEQYTLALRSDRCSSLTPDAFEPNDACGPYAPLPAGTHSLTLTSGESDGFIVQIPVGHSMRARVTFEGYERRIGIGGAAAPNCPPAFDYQTHFQSNYGPTPLDYHLRVDSLDESCAQYTLEVSFELNLCSPAHIAENEPNDDCLSATPISLTSGHASIVSALTPGDVDHFRVTIPAGQELEISPLFALFPVVGFRLTATAQGDCSGRSWSITHPESEYVLPAYEARLPNRGTTAQDYVLRVEPTGPLTECTTVALILRVVPPIEPGPHTTCQAAGPVGDWNIIWGDLGRDHSLFAATTVEPGQTLTAAFFEGVGVVNAPLELRFHDGTVDCEARNASLGSSRYVPPAALDYDSPSWATLRHQYTNTSSAPRRVIVELAEDPDYCQWFTRVALTLDLTPGSPFETFCVGNAVTYTTVVCPCDNGSQAEHAEGCTNSTGRGARLSATGTTSIAANDWFLLAEGLPRRTPVIVMGIRTFGPTGNSNPRTFMDGRLCLGDGVEAMFTGAADGNGLWASPSPLPGLLGTLTPGERVYLQAWYRDTSGACGTGSNLTNGVRVDWE